jgi:hypothetical protein
MVSAIYNFVPDESLRQITLTSLASVICGVCEICGYLLSSVFRLKHWAEAPYALVGPGSESGQR